MIYGYPSINEVEENAFQDAHLTKGPYHNPECITRSFGLVMRCSPNSSQLADECARVGVRASLHLFTKTDCVVSESNAMAGGLDARFDGVEVVPNHALDTLSERLCGTTGLIAG